MSHFNTRYHEEINDAVMEAILVKRIFAFVLVDSVIHILNNWEQLIAHFVPCDSVVHVSIIEFPKL